jgi:hypothetical protein
MTKLLHLLEHHKGHVGVLLEADLLDGDRAELIERT